jgi:hypothetical protein
MVWTAPRTWVDGEEPPAATLNLHVRDQLNMLSTTNDWTPLTLLNGWRPYDPDYYEAPAVKKQGGRIFCRGMITAGTFTPGTNLAVIPTGYYNSILPTRIHIQPCWGRYVRVDVSHVTQRLLISENSLGTNGWLSLHMWWYLT